MLNLHGHMSRPEGMLPIRTPDTRNLIDSPEIMALYGKYIGCKNVNVGCALNHIIGPGEWINVDSNIECRPNLLCNVLDLAAFLGSGTVDCVFASHFLEHLTYQDLFLAYDQFWKILRPGGHVLAFVPHGASDQAWEDPFHTMRFSVMTFAYLRGDMYTVPGNAGYGGEQGMRTHPWEIISLAQVPMDEWKGKSDAELALAASRYNNVIREVHCVMRKEANS